MEHAAWPSDSNTASAAVAGAPAAAAPAAMVAMPAPAACEAKKGAPAPRGDWLTRYVQLLQRRAVRVSLLVFWLLIFAAGIIAVGPVFGNLRLQARPPCARANARFGSAAGSSRLFASPCARAGGAHPRRRQ